MFREKYKHMNDQIKPSPQLINSVIYDANNKKKQSIVCKPMAIATVLLLCFFTTIPVLAATVPAVYEAIYHISPSTAQFFKPIQKSCEDNGISMQVEAAYIHDNVAEICITMQDLTGERIDGTIDLFDSYSINRSFDSFATCQRVGYDEHTKTATFLISITEWGNKKIVGDKITFSVREFLSNKHEYNNIPIELDLTKLDSNPKTKQTATIGGGGPKYNEYVPNHEDSVKVLASSTPYDFPVEGINLTGIGYVDDMLHIQTSVENNLTKDNHGYFFFLNKSGDKIQCDYNIGFVENFDSDKRVDYCEYVFNIPQSEIGQYALYGNFVTSGMFTDGNWEVTFQLEEAKK